MGSVESEKYCLKWNDFTSNLSSAFNELRDDEDFFDVTLITEESEIRCHKLILGACSPHFRHIIKRLSTVQNPAIYLRGVRHEDIKNILEFMYLGQVSVAQEDLDSFLSVAQDLMIKGLTQNQDGSTSNVGSSATHTFSSTPKASTSSANPPPTKRLKMSKNAGDAIKSSSKKTEIKQDPDPVVDLEQEQMDNYDEYYEEAGPSESGEEGKGFYEDDIKGCGLTKLDDGKVLCTHCGKVLNAMRSAKRHFAITHQENEPLQCKICQATCKNRPALNKHVNRLHRMSIKDAENLVAAAEIKKEHEQIGNDSEMATQPLNALVETTLESTNSK